MARRVLIVSTVEHGDDVLQAHVGEADEVRVVVPVVRQGALDWLTNDEKASGGHVATFIRGRATRRAPELFQQRRRPGRSWGSEPE
jgi:hypothetical protein